MTTFVKNPDKAAAAMSPPIPAPITTAVLPFDFEGAYSASITFDPTFQRWCMICCCEVGGISFLFTCTGCWEPNLVGGVFVRRTLATLSRQADARRRMSRFGWKTDGILEGAEGRFMTQAV